MLNFNFLQFREILGIPSSFDSEWPHCWNYLKLPLTKIPKWLKFNHHQSFGNSVSFLVDPRFSNLVVCISIPSKDVDNDKVYSEWSIHILINGKEQLPVYMEKANSNSDHVWLIYRKVNISNPSEENRIEVEVRDESRMNTFSLNRMRIYVECICCPQKPNISPTSSMDQCAFNNGEEDSGRFGIQRRLQRRNHRPTHARSSQKHYLSHFGWLRIRFQL